MWSDIIAAAAELEAQQKDEEARAAAARRLAELDAVDAARSELIGLLGPLADELEIGYEGMTYGVRVFPLRPRHWRPDIDRGFYARYRAGDDGRRNSWVLGVERSAENSSDIALDRPIAADSVGQNVVRWLAARQGEYDRAVAKRAKGLLEKLAADPRDSTTGPVEARAFHHELCQLDPANSDEWDGVYGLWSTLHGAKLAEVQREEEETAAALERFRAELTKWQKAKANVDEVNQANIDRLIRQVDVTVHVCDLEYALGAHDEDGVFHLETRTVQVVAILATASQSTVLKDGRSTKWLFENTVRLSDSYSVRPSEAARRGLSQMFATKFTPYGAVVFTEHFRDQVEEVIAGLVPVPDEPEWIVIGGGRMWTEEVGRVYDEVFGRK